MIADRDSMDQCHAVSGLFYSSLVEGFPPQGNLKSGASDQAFSNLPLSSLRHPCWGKKITIVVKRKKKKNKEKKLFFVV